MKGPDPGLSEHFRDKCECVIDIPPWMLSPERADVYRSTSGLAMVEIAGRDSVAAAVKAVGEEGFTQLLPTYAYTGTEHGAWSSVEDAVKRLAERLPPVRVHPLLVMGSPRFWQALNGRFMSELIARYGFLSPCIGCHLYLHSVRIPLAVTLGKISIISGERERHNGTVKINQIGEALTLYEALAGEFGVRLLFPLRHISDGDQIGEILGFEWQEGKEQLGCVLSGNYRGVDGSVNLTEEQVVRYLETFACPVTREIVAAYLGGEVPDHLKIAARVLGS
ncbi:MAG: hypothetical protein R6X27_03785 [Candidatus Desulfacyla sp.]